MVYDGSIDGVLTHLIFLDDAYESSEAAFDDQDGSSADNCELYVALGVCLFLILKGLQRNCFSTRKTNIVKDSEQNVIQQSEHQQTSTISSFLIAIYDLVLRKLQNGSERLWKFLFGRNTNAGNQMDTNSQVDHRQQVSSTITSQTSVTNQQIRITRVTPQDLLQARSLSSFKVSDVIKQIQTSQIKSISEIKPSQNSERSLIEGFFRKPKLSVSGSASSDEKSSKKPNVFTVSLNTKNASEKPNMKPPLANSTLSMLSSRSLLEKDHRRLSLAPSEKERHVSVHTKPPKGDENMVFKVEELLNSNKRCMPETAFDTKLPLFLTYSSLSTAEVIVPPKRRSIFSRSHSRNKYLSVLKTPLDHVDVDTSTIEVTNEVDKTISDTFQNMPEVSLKMTDLSRDKANTPIYNSLTELQASIPVKRTPSELKSLRCCDKQRGETEQDFTDEHISYNMTSRKKKTVIDKVDSSLVLSSGNMMYDDCINMKSFVDESTPNNPKLVYEVCAGRGSRESTVEEHARHSKLNKEYSKQALGGINQEDGDIVKGRKKSSSSGKLDIVSSKMQQMNRPNENRSLVNDFSKTNKRSYNLLENSLHSQRIEHLTLSDIQEIDTYDNTRADLSSNIEEGDKISKLKDMAISPGNKDNYKQGHMSKMSPLHSQEKVGGSLDKYKPGTGISDRSLLASRSESIRMVESLLSVHDLEATDNNIMPAVAGTSISRQCVPRDQSAMFPVSTSEGEKIMDLNVTPCFSPDTKDSMETLGQKSDLRNEKAAKKSLRFVSRSGNTKKADSRHGDATTPSPIGWSRVNKTLKSLSENYEDTKLDRKRKNCIDYEESRTSKVNDYPIIFDKLIRKSKNHIKNTILLCNSAKTTMYEKLNGMKLQGPGSVRARKIRPISTRFPTLMSFLDHIEQEENERDKQLKSNIHTQEELAENCKRVSYENDRKKPKDSSSPCHGTHGTRNSDFHHATNEKRSKTITASIADSRLQKASNVKIKENEMTRDTTLHFGTNVLELYSESVESIRCPKRETTPKRATFQLHNSPDASGSTKRSLLITNSTRVKPRTLHAWNKPNSLSHINTSRRNAKVVNFRHWTKDALKNMKRNLNEKVGKRDIKVVHKRILEKPTATDGTGHLGEETDSQRKADGKPLADARNRPIDVQQSLFASPDATRGFEMLSKIELSDTRECPSNSNSLAAKCKIEEPDVMHESIAAVTSGDPQVQTAASSNYKPKSNKTMKKFKTLIPCRKYSSTESSCRDNDSNVLKDRVHLINYSETSTIAEQPTVVEQNGGINRNKARIETGHLEQKYMNLDSSRSSLMQKPTADISKLTHKDTSDNSRLSQHICSSDNISPYLSTSENDNLSMSNCKTDSNKLPISVSTLNKANGLQEEHEKGMGLLSTSPICTDIKGTHSTHNGSDMGVDGSTVLTDNQKLSTDKFNCEAVIPVVPPHCDIKQTILNDVPLKKSYIVKNSDQANASRGRIMKLNNNIARRRNLRAKDTYDRYLVHTSEFPRRHAAKHSPAHLSQTTCIDDDQHCSLLELDIQSKSPEGASSQIKHEAANRIWPSYTSKHRAKDHTDKNMQSAWRGTVAFRKRLQHLLQHNKDLQMKHKNLHMYEIATSKTSSGEINPCAGSNVSAIKDQTLNLNRISKLVKPNCPFPNRINRAHSNQTKSKPRQSINIKRVSEITSPIMKKLKIKNKYKNKKTEDKFSVSVAPSVEVSVRNETKIDGMGVGQIVISKDQARGDEKKKLSAKDDAAETGKHILTHSDLFEQRIQSHILKRKEEMEHKLIRIKSICKVKDTRSVTPTLISNQHSQVLPSVDCKNVTSCTLIDHKVFIAQPRLLWQKKQIEKGKDKLQEIVETSIGTQGKDASEETENATKVDLPYIRNSSHQHKLISERAIAAKLHSRVLAGSLDQANRDKVELVNVSRDVKRQDFISQTGELIEDELATDRVELKNAHVTQTENNLQQLLDKIKQSCSLAITSRHGKGIQMTTSSATLRENVKHKVRKNKSDIGTSPMSTDNLSLPLPSDASDKKERSWTASFIDNAHSICPQSKQNHIKTQDFLSEIRADTMTHGDISHGLDNQITGVEIADTNFRTESGDINRTIELHKDLKSEMTTKTGITLGTSAPVTTSDVILESSYKDAILRMQKAKLFRNRSLTGYNYSQNVKNSFPYDIILGKLEEKDTIVDSNVKHVDFDCKHQQSKREAIPQIKTDTETSQLNHVYTGVCNVDTEMFVTFDKQNTHQETKLNQTMPNGCDDPEKRTGTDRIEYYVDPSSDASHNFERRQSATADMTVRSSPGYFTMETVSPVSMSLLQNNRSMESEQWPSELVNVCEIIAHNTTNVMVADPKEEVDLPPFTLGKYEECRELLLQNMSQAINFRKKDLHMDVIPEEVDYESGVETFNEVKSVLDRSSDSDTKRISFEKTTMKPAVVKTSKDDSVVAEKQLLDEDGAAETEKKDSDNDGKRFMKTEIGTKNDSVKDKCIHTSSKMVDDTHLEISLDKQVRSLRISTKERYSSEVNGEPEPAHDFAEDRLRHLSCVITDEHVLSDQCDAKTHNNTDSNYDLKDSHTQSTQAIDSKHIYRRATLNKKEEQMIGQENLELVLPTTSSSTMQEFDNITTGATQTFSINRTRTIPENLSEVQFQQTMNDEQNIDLSSLKSNDRVITAPLRIEPAHVVFTCHNDTVAPVTIIETASEHAHARSNNDIANTELRTFDSTTWIDTSKQDAPVEEKAHRDDVSSMKSEVVKVQVEAASHNLRTQAAEILANLQLNESMSTFHQHNNIEKLYKSRKETIRKQNCSTEGSPCSSSSQPVKKNVKLSKIKEQLDSVNIKCHSVSDKYKSEEEDASEKMSEPANKLKLTYIKETSSPGEMFPLPLHGKTPSQIKSDTKIKSCEKRGSECGIKTSVRTVSACKEDSRLQHPEKAELTQTVEHRDNDMSISRKTVGLQVGNTRIGENTNKAIENSQANINKGHVTSVDISSSEQRQMIIKETLKHYLNTKSTKCSSNKSESGKTVEKNAENRERNLKIRSRPRSINGQKSKEISVSLQDLRRNTEPGERNTSTCSDDLESLLNRELSQSKSVGRIRRDDKINRLFSMTYDRTTRRERRKRRADKSLSQFSNQLELHYHFLREKDRSLKSIASNTSQVTMFSPSDTTVQLHSQRYVKPLVPRFFTNLEEFLQRTEENTKTETSSSFSRAVSKLSSFTSVTPSSQEDEQLQQLLSHAENQHPANNSPLVPAIADMKCIKYSDSCTLSSEIFLPEDKVDHVKSNANRHDDLTECHDGDNTRALKSSNVCPNTQSTFLICGILDKTDVNKEPRKRENTTLVNITESDATCENHKNIYCSEFKKTMDVDAACTTRACNDQHTSKTARNKMLNIHLAEDEASVESSIYTCEADTSHANIGVYVIPENSQSIKSHVIAGISQTTEGSSTLSTSSSSIVLSWIGSDLPDIEDTLLVTPSIVDHYSKASCELTTRQSTSFPYTPTRDSEKSSAIPSACILNSYYPYDARDCLSRGTYTKDTSNTWMAVKSINELENTPSKYDGCTPAMICLENDQKMSNRELNEYVMQEDAEHSRLANGYQNNQMWLSRLECPITDHAYTDCHTKQPDSDRHTQMALANCYTFIKNDLEPNSENIYKSTNQGCSTWNYSRESTLDQPSYFCALLRDPKWNPSFDVKEDKCNVGQNNDQSHFVGNYVQSAWTYQNIRHISPMTSPRCKDKQDSPTSVHSTGLNYHDTNTSPRCLRSNTQNQSDTILHSNISKYKCTTKKMAAGKSDVGTSAKSSFSEYKKHGQNYHSPKDVPCREGVIEKHNGFYRKVHFDNSSEHSDQCNSVNQCNSDQCNAWHGGKQMSTSRGGKDKSKEITSVDERMKTSSKPGAACEKNKCYGTQQRNGNVHTRTKTKMSLEQHLCSTSDTVKIVRSRCNAAQSASDNGTTKSTSSHASLNWYKPQSLSSSSSVNNGNAIPSQKDTLVIPSLQLNESVNDRVKHVQHTQTHDSKISTDGTMSGQDPPSPSMGNAQGNDKNQPTTTIGYETFLSQTLATEFERASSDSLSTPSSASVQNTYKRPGFRRLRMSESITSPLNNFPPYPSGQTKGNKSVRRFVSSSDYSRRESKQTTPATTAAVEITAATHRSLGIRCPSGRCGSSVISTRSAQSNCMKKITTKHESSQVEPNQVTLLKKTRAPGESINKKMQKYVCDEWASRNSEATGTRQRQTPPSRAMGDSHTPDSHATQDGDSTQSSSLKSVKRVSKLVEMFEKKFES